jgi:hypothetical protein
VLFALLPESVFLPPQLILLGIFTREIHASGLSGGIEIYFVVGILACKVGSAIGTKQTGVNLWMGVLKIDYYRSNDTKQTQS